MEHCSRGPAIRERLGLGSDQRRVQHLSEPDCSWSANASGGEPPYRFDWVVNGNPWYNTPSVTYTNAGHPFTLNLTGTDKYGVAATSARTIYISPNSPCLFQ
jgi:hypothetical protein